MAKLGEVCIQITDGSHNPPSGVEQSEYLMLSSKNIDDDFITLDSPRFLSHSDYIAENNRTTVCEGDLLMTIVGTIGRVAIVPKELNGICLQRSVAVIKPEREIVNNRYLMYQLQNMRPFLEKEARGVAQKGIYLKQVSQLDIKIPELEHQMQIVKVLDKASKLIFLRKQQLAKLDELVKARFVEMFGDPVSNPFNWLTAELGNRCEIITGNTPSRAEPENYGTFIEWIKSDNINTPSTFLTEAQERLSEIGFQKCRFVESGSLLMTCIAGSLNCIGNVAVANRRVAFNQQINAITPTHDNVLYLYWLMILSKPTIHRTINMALKGILSKSQLSLIKFPFPPLPLQNQFAAFVERVDQQKQTVQQSLEKLELMKKALMQEYFG